MRLHQLFHQADVRSQVFKAEEDARQRISRLTPQQRKIVQAMINGHANKTIAYRLGLSTRTVENHRAAIHDRLDVKNVADMLRLAILADVNLVVEDADVSSLS